jgi:hypothetical protein
LCHDRTVETADNDRVSFVENTVGKDDIDGCSETLDDLDLEDGTLESGDVHEALSHALLSELDDEHQHVGNTLTGVSRCRDERDVLREVLVLVVRKGVESLLGEGEDRVGETLFVFVLDGLLLLRERVLETVVLDGLPTVETIDLVERDDEGGLTLAEETEGLEGLRLETVLLTGRERQYCVKPEREGGEEQDAP